MKLNLCIRPELKSTGIGITEFIMIIAIVAIAGIISFQFLGENIVDLFKGASDKIASANDSIKNNQTKDEDTTLETTSDTTLETTLDTTSDTASDSTVETSLPPVSNCNSGYCEMTFGDYTLTNVPQNFDDIIVGAAAGVGGATDTIASLMMQISDQLEAEGSTTESDALRNLASRFGYDIINQYGSYSGDSIAQVQMNAEWALNFKADNIVDIPGIELVNGDRYINTKTNDMLAYKVGDEFILGDPWGNDPIDSSLASMSSTDDSFAKYEDFLNSNASSEVKDIVSTLFNSGIALNTSFAEQLNSGETNPDDIKNYVTSKTEDLYGQLMLLNN